MTSNKYQPSPESNTDPCKHHYQSQGQEGWLAPAQWPKKITQFTASTPPDLKVRKVGLPPLSCPKDHSILCNHLTDLKVRKVGLPPLSCPREYISTLEALIPISRLGSVLASEMSDLLGNSAGASPPSLP